jgi:hypothetical protein
MSPTFRLSPAVTSASGAAVNQAHKGFDSICHLVTSFSYRNKEREENKYIRERRRENQVTGDTTPLKGLPMLGSASLLPKVTLGDNQVTNHLARAA